MPMLTRECDADERRPCKPRTVRAGGGLIAISVAATLIGMAAPAAAQELRPIIAAAPFTTTLSNNVPLAYGMNATETAQALGAPLSYISGRPGEEILLALRSAGGSGFFERRDRLYLQFRAGRLTGWKGDWGRNWMWQ